MNWADLIGIPWEAGAQGPEAYDCWAFFRMCQRESFGVEVPLILAQDYDDPQAIADLFARHDERQRWDRVDDPAEGDAVLIHKPMHIGLWLPIDGGGVLHCVRGAGVIFTHDAVWSMSGFGRREFYRLRRPA